MEKYLKYSLVALIFVFAALSLLAILTDALPLIKRVNPYFFALSALFFVLSIVFWIIPWALLLKNNRKLSLRSMLVIGFSCVYGALTPVQIGAEALRSIKAKDIFGISYSESISAAMVVKGLKFFMLALVASIVVWMVLWETKLSLVMLVGLLSGFSVIIFASALFLLPLDKKIGLMISKIFGELSNFWKKFSLLEKYFHDYSNYLEVLPKEKFFAVFLLAGLSILLEFVALLFSFFALEVFIDVFPLLFLFIIISILERTPFLPRGIGVVEAAGFIFLSLPEFSQLSLSVAQVGAILIVFDVVRLIIPTILSLAFSLIKVNPVKK